VKYHANISSGKSHHNKSTFKSKDNELAEISEKEFRIILLKMINDLKEDSNKHIKVRNQSKK
jgi:aromatic ring-opening dioxygenase catalytic subunit (LigB family)